MLDLKQELNPRLTDTLRCPVCGAPMSVTAEGRGLACAATLTSRNPKGKTHLFDGGAGGYVNLAPHHSGGGDSKEAVRARSAFLRSGYYTPAAEAIASLVGEITPKDGLVLDAGCGEGYYSGRIAAEGYPVLGVDLSKFATDTAAKAARRERMNRGQDSSTLYAVTRERARELIDAYGVGRVLFGTDYPMWLPESEIELFMQIDLTEDERQDILSRNAAKLFGIPTP